MNSFILEYLHEIYGEKILNPQMKIAFTQGINKRLALIACARARVDVDPVHGSKYIRSITEPFNDEMKLDAERVYNWLNLFDLDLHGMDNKDKLHASGHASGPEIFETISKIEPKKVFPIHTEKPEIFRDNCQQVTLVKKDHTYKL